MRKLLGCLLKVTDLLIPHLIVDIVRSDEDLFHVHTGTEHPLRLRLRVNIDPVALVEQVKHAEPFVYPII